MGEEPGSMPEQPATPSNPVREVRQALGLTQLEMAVKLGCSHFMGWRCEDKRMLPRETAILIELRTLAKRAGIHIEPDQSKPANG
jgi:transcriptional regulator with XRE-family HTH domain